MDRCELAVPRFTRHRVLTRGSQLPPVLLEVLQLGVGVVNLVGVVQEVDPAGHVVGIAAAAFEAAFTAASHAAHPPEEVGVGPPIVLEQEHEPVLEPAGGWVEAAQVVGQVDVVVSHPHWLAKAPLQKSAVELRHLAHTTCRAGGRCSGTTSTVSVTMRSRLGGIRCRLPPAGSNTALEAGNCERDPSSSARFGVTAD